MVIEQTITTMSIIEEIKQSRIEALSQEHKDAILNFVKKKLLTSNYCVISVPYPDPIWHSDDISFDAPRAVHPQIAEWLRSLGFHTDREYNSRGVDTGLKVWI